MNVSLLDVDVNLKQFSLEFMKMVRIYTINNFLMMLFVNFTIWTNWKLLTAHDECLNNYWHRACVEHMQNRWIHVIFPADNTCKHRASFSPAFREASLSTWCCILALLCLAKPHFIFFKIQLVWPLNVLLLFSNLTNIHWTNAQNLVM